MEPILSVSNVTKRFGGLVAVDDISFTLEKGEIIGLMGPNGAGKTTLFNVITGVYKPDSGIIKFENKKISGLPPYKVCRLGISRTYQIPQPFLNLKVFQNVTAQAMYGGGLGKSEAEREAKKALEITPLKDKSDWLAKDLLILDLKTLELCRAIASRPKLILIDEVGAGLTEVEIPRLLEVLKTIHSQGVTIILIEHVLTIMQKAVERIIVMDGGAKIAEGSPETIMKSEKVIKAYLGDSF